MKDAVIIGGGIAGLGAALFAKQFGLSLPIYEKNPQLECQDNLLWLAPNGLAMIDRLGLLAEVKQKARAQDSMVFASQQLKPLMQMKGSALAAQLGWPILAIRRGDLYRLLLDKFLAAGGVVHFDHRLEAIQQTQDKLLLSFANREPVLCEYAIAADGIGSATRQLIFPESFVRYQGLRTYLGKSHSPAAKHFVGQTFEIWGQGTRFVVTSLDGETAYWSAIERPLVYEKNQAPLPANIVENLQKTFADYHPYVQELLKAATAESIHRSNFGVVAGLPRYFHGRIGLIGDAAHGMPPNMGQGASLGLEDALNIVKLLAADSEGGLFFAQHDRMRRKRAKQMMQLANSMNTSFQPKTRWASALRNLIAALIPDRLSEMRMVQLYRLPDYLQESVPSERASL